jgi:hypothetical protein
VLFLKKTKKVYNLKGKVYVNAIVKTREGTTIQRGNSASHNVKTYREVMKDNAYWNAGFKHFSEFGYEGSDITGRIKFKDIEEVDYYYMYEDYNIKRIRENGKYYTRITDKKTGEEIFKEKWSSKT